MNYGIDKEDLSFKVEDLGEFTRQGYSFQVEGNKTYVIKNGRLVSIVDNGTKLKDMKALLNGNKNISGNFIHDDANHEILGNFVSEIESSTGREVESITFGPDGYELIVDGEKVKVPYAENGSISLDDVTSRVSKKVTYKASDKLSEDNKDVIENYLNETLGDGYETKVVLNEDGVYEIQVNGTTLAILDKDATLSDAVKAASNELSNGKSLSDYTPSTDTYRLKAKTGQNYKVHIDVETFEAIQQQHNNALTIMDGCKGTYKVNFTDKLATFYESVVGANTDPTERIDKSVELLNNITLNVKYSLQAYENIDHELGMIFNSVVNEIFQMNSYADEETREFYNKPLEEREKYLDGLIKTYTEQLNELQQKYDELYANGAIFSEDESDFILGVLHALGLDTGQQYVLGNGNGVKYLNIDLDDFVENVQFMNDNEVFEKLTAYANGASWRESGMSELNGLIMGYEQYDSTSERYFVRRYLEAQSSDYLVEISQKYPQTYKDLYNDDRYKLNPRRNGGLKIQLDQSIGDDYFVDEIKNHLRNQLKTKTVVDSEGEEEVVNPFEYVQFQYYEKEALHDSINGLSNTIYNYKQYKGLMPYEAEMTGEEYMKFLVQDYSNLTGNDKLKYLDQRELALYQMYKSKGQTDKANQYLNAMDDLINQRIGYQEAAERIMEYGGVDGFLKSGWDGFKDGFEQFFANIGNCFSADGKRSAADYRNMFMISLLGDDNLYNKDLSQANRTALRYNYQIMSSIGQQTIPTLAYFIPGVGKVLSPVLQAAAAFGSSRENALLTGASSAQAYLYATLSGVSTVILNKCMSGIAGLNGNTQALESVSGYLKSLPQQAARTLLGTYLDGGLRSMILGEPFDISKLTEQGFEAAIQGAFTAALMNGTNKVMLKIANGVTIAVTGKTYQEFCANVEKKMWDTSIGQKVKALKAAGGERWEQFKANHPNNLLVQAIATYQYNHSADMPIDIDRETAEKMGITLKDGESLCYDPDSNSYHRIDAKGNHYTIPITSIKDYEGGMYIELSPYEQMGLRAKHDPTLRSNMVKYEGMVRDKVMIEYAQQLANTSKADYGGDWDAAYAAELARLKSDDCPPDQREMIDTRVRAQMDRTATQGQYVTSTPGGAYTTLEDYYADLAGGSYRKVTPKYDQDRMTSYQTGASPGNVNVTATYTDWKSGFLGKTKTGQTVDEAMSGMAVGQSVEIDPTQTASFGNGQQFVGSTSQVDGVYGKIAANSSASNPAVDQVTSYLGVDGGADRIVQVSMEVPQSDLSYPHYDTPRANSQFTTGGLPPQTLSDGTIVSGYEGVIPSVNLNDPNVNNLNTRVRVLDPQTGKVKYEGTYYYSGGKLYFKRTK